MQGITRFKKLLQQRSLKWVLSGIGCGVILVGVNLKFNAAEKQKRSKSSATKIETADDNMNHIARWTSEVGAERQAMQKELDSTKQDLAKANQELASIKRGIANRDVAVSKQLQAFRDDITNSVEDSIKKGLETNKKLPSNAKPTGTTKIVESTAAFQSVGGAGAVSPNIYTQAIYPVPAKKKSLGFGLVTVNLQDKQNNSIGAGDIVSATLLSGVVVSTATNSSTDPRPVVMELLDGVDSPAKWFFSKQKKCLIIGGAYGSISDERAYVRLETLRCINRETGRSVETTINGFVSDESGRAGIRGTVVTRDRQFLMNSVIGGTLAGAASAFNQLSTPSSSYNPFTGNVNQQNTTKNLLQQAGSQGIGNALDRYAKYQIERAQMLEPVIQVSAGRRVDIVFTKGVALGTIGRPPNIKNIGEAVSTSARDSVASISELEHVSVDGKQMAAEFLEQARGN